MNILPLNILNTTNYRFARRINSEQQNTNFGLKMASPLAVDSVSFGATPKTLQSWKGAMSRNVANDIYNITSTFSRNCLISTYVKT